MARTKKEEVLARVSDLVSDFCYYDRKEDEDLSPDDLKRMLDSGEITGDQIVARFAHDLFEWITRNLA